MSSCGIDYRHVCMKDLENYIVRDKYFSDFTDKEKEEIRKNLGLSEVNDLLSSSIIEDNYENIRKLAELGKLSLQSKYIINDFQSIYMCNGEVFGKKVHPSETYRLILTPISNSQFDKRIMIDSKWDWIVFYDITSEKLGFTWTKGKILYMEDENHNSAYYDFKNILIYKPFGETHYHTFDDGKTNDASSQYHDNHLSQSCSGVVFLKESNYNELDRCTDVTFKNTATDNKLFDCNNVTFKNKVVKCTGSVTNKQLSNITESDYYKNFAKLGDKQVCTYLDPLTETLQVEKI